MPATPPPVCSGAPPLALDPVFFLWLGPVLVGPLLSIPLSLITAQPPDGGTVPWSLATPEELTPPAVARSLAAHLGTRETQAPPAEFAADYGLLQAVLDPYVNAIHVSLLREKEHPAAADRERFATLREKLIAAGPAALPTRDKLALLMDAPSMIRLHRDLWSRPGVELAEWWRHAIRQYNFLAPAPATALDR